MRFRNLRNASRGVSAAAGVVGVDGLVGRPLDTEGEGEDDVEMSDGWGLAAMACCAIVGVGTLVLGEAVKWGTAGQLMGISWACVFCKESVS